MRATLLIVALLAVQCLAQTNCGVTLKDDKNKKAYKYDLTPLYHEPGLSDTLYYRDTEGNYFYVNFCGTTTSSCTTGSAVCQRASNYRYYGCGALSTQNMLASNSTDIAVNTGLMVVYTEGDECSGGPKRSTIIHVACSKTASPGYFYDAFEGDCAYVLKMWSAAGCPTEVPYGGASGSGSDNPTPKGGLSVGSILLIVIFVLVIVYFVGGVIFQWKVRGAQSGREYVPNNEFWFGLPSLVKDGVLFIAHGFKKGDYTSI